MNLSPSRTITLLLFPVGLVLSACGGEEPLGEVVNVCAGQQGLFRATPTLGFSSCLNIPPTLPDMTLEVEANDTVTRCGWHELSETTRDNLLVPGCRDTYRRSLKTVQTGYKGLIILDVRCQEGRSCSAVWELEFEQQMISPGRL